MSTWSRLRSGPGASQGGCAEETAGQPGVRGVPGRRARLLHIPRPEGSPAMDLPLTRSYWPADTSRPVLDLTTGEVLRRAAAAAPDRLALVEVALPGASLSGADRTDRTWTY